MVTHKEALELATAKAWKEEIAGTRKASEVIIRAYLDARGLVMVPRETTEGMVRAGNLARMNVIGGYDGPSPWSAMLAAAPDPFGDAE